MKTGSHSPSLATLRALQGETVKTARSLASLKKGKTDWYRIENNAGSATDAYDVYIYDEIGYFGVTAQDFVSQFRADISPRAEVTVHINSPGGTVFDGITILNVLRNHQGAVTTIVDGWALSAASFIAQAGSKRIMGRNSQMMIHDAMSMCIGNAREMRESADLLDKASNNLADIYAERSGRGTSQDWRGAMEKEVWYSAQEAVDAGLADEVDGQQRAEQGEESLAASWDLSIFAHAKRSDAPEPEIFRAPEPEPPSQMFDLTAFKKGLGHGA